MTLKHEQTDFIIAEAAAISAAKERAKLASLEALEAFREIGNRLIAIKGHFTENNGPKGAFSTLTARNDIDMSDAWRWKLMKLAENWNDIQRALVAIPERERNRYSVQEVLGIYDEWLKVNDPKKKAKVAAKAEARAKAEAETAQQTIDDLNSEAAAESEEQPLYKWPFAKLRTPDVDQQETLIKTVVRKAPSMTAKTTAQRYWWVMHRGFDAEAEAAKQRFGEMAWNHGMTEVEFAEACGPALNQPPKQTRNLPPRTEMKQDRDTDQPAEIN